MLENQRSKEIKVGIVSILGLSILFIGLMLGKGFKFGSESELITIRFPNSGGIQIGEPVVVNGVKRGSVNEIQNNNGSVIVKVRLDNFDDIKSDAEAKITILELTGGKKVEIFPGTASSKFNINDEMPGTTPPDLPELIRLVGEVSGDAVNLVRRLDTIAGQGTALLSDGKVVSDIRATLSNTVEITQSAKELISQNQKKLQDAIDNLATISKDLKNFIADNKNDLSRIIDNVDSTILSTRDLLVKVDTAVKNADILLRDANTLVNDVRNGDGFVTKLIYDKDVANRLDSTLTTLFFFLEQVKEHGVNVNLRLGSRP